MKKLLLFSLALFFGLSLSAQHYEIVTPNDTLTKTPDTLFYHVPIIGEITTDAVLTVHYQGNFYYDDQYLLVYSSDWNSLGTTSNFYNNTCTDDSMTIIIPKDSIISWESGGYIDFQLISTPWINLGDCSFNGAQLKLSYDYCVFGTPVEFASISASDSVFCSYDSQISLLGSPSAGSFYGPGVSGSTFSPLGLAAGIYFIHYTATDAIGCTTTATQKMIISPKLVIMDTLICPNTAATLHPYYFSPTFWYDSPALSNLLDSSEFFTTPLLSQSTTYYAVNNYSEDYFEMTSFADTSAYVMDFGVLISDDRGGIAITPNYVYFVGDGGIGRFDHDLSIASAKLFPINDGIFSDLKSGALLSLWNESEYMNYDYNENYDVSYFRVLDADMNVMEAIALSQTIEMGYMNNNSNIFAGYGFTILYSGNDDHFYKVDNTTGEVSDLGDSYLPDAYDSENWANWGIAEYDGSDYSVIYRDDSGSDLIRLNLTTGAKSVAAGFSDLDDCATFSYSRWDSRWYLHFEGGSQFNGDEESGCYLNATAEITNNPGIPFGCYSEVTAIINTVDIGPSDTTICTGESLVLYAGMGFSSYTWNGISNNWNVCFADTAGTYTVEVTDNIGCTLTDAITVTIDSCTGINDPDAALINIFPNPASDVVNIEIPADLLSGNSILMIADAQGRIVLRKELAGIENGFNYQLDVKSLDRGVYQLIITSAEKQFTYRLVRQ